MPRATSRVRLFLFWDETYEWNFFHDDYFAMPIVSGSVVIITSLAHRYFIHHLFLGIA
jgi:hypothetical protein